MVLLWMIFYLWIFKKSIKMMKKYPTSNWENNEEEGDKESIGVSID